MSAQISPEIETTIKSLKRRGFDARFAENRQAAGKMVIDLVPQNAIVGCGDSTTIRSIGVIQGLTDMGNMVLNPFFKPKVMREKTVPLSLAVMKQICQGCEVFMASANAVTQDGKIVSIDGGGMRAAGMFFGPSLTILVIGRNKIVKNSDEAIHRIKNVIAPAHARTIGPDWGIPCVATGRCVEPETLCGDGSLRLCNVVVILEGKPPIPDTHYVVIDVDEDLGLGWDPAWSKERIDKIYREYKEFTPPHRPSGRTARKVQSRND